MNLFAIRIETDKMTKLNRNANDLFYFFQLFLGFGSVFTSMSARVRVLKHSFCARILFWLWTLFLPSSIAMKTKYTWEAKKNKNLQLHVNKQLCIHYWCGATKYFVDVNVNSLHMSHYTSFMYRLIYWLSRQKFVSCQPVKLRSSISGPFRLKCNRQRCAVIYTDFYRNINYFEGIKSHQSMNFASMWIYRDFLD